MAEKRRPAKSGQPDRRGPIVGLQRETYDLARELSRREDRYITDVITDAIALYAESVGYAPRKSKGWKRAQESD